MRDADLGGVARATRSDFSHTRLYGSLAQGIERYSVHQRPVVAVAVSVGISGFLEALEGCRVIFRGQV
jgi:hypothetical protein